MQKSSTTIYPQIMSEDRYWSTPASSCFMGNTVDADLLPFLKKLNSRHWIVSMSCCSGHDGETAYVSVGVKVAYVKQFVAMLNNLTQYIKDREQDAVLVVCEFNFETTVATSCDFENFPEWLMFHIEFWCADDDPRETDLEFWEFMAGGLFPSKLSLKCA